MTENGGQEIKWKTISNHKWDSDDYYNEAVQYLTSRSEGKKYIYWPLHLRQNKNSSIMDNNKRKARYEFKEKMKYYNLDEKNQIVVENIRFGRENLLYTPDSKTTLHYIIKPSQKNNIIQHIIDGKDIETMALNTQSIYKRLINNFNIANISKNEISQFIKNVSHIMREVKDPGKKPTIKSYRPKYPRQHWQMDTVHMQKNGKAMSGNNGIEFFLVIIDIFSKFVYIKAIKTQHSKLVAKHLEDIFLNGDIPEVIQCDNGKEFKKEVITLLKKYNIHQRWTPSYSPQTNGFAENRNKLIKSMIYVHLVHQNKERKTKILRWIDAIPQIQYAINTAFHSVTNLSPVQIHFGISVDTKFKTTEFNNINFNNSAPETFEKFDNINFNKSDITTEFKLTDEEKNLQQSYYKESKNIEEKRINFVANKIRKVADKRELKQEEQLHDRNLKLRPGTFVRIYSLMKRDKEYEPIQLQVVHSQDGIVIKNKNAFSIEPAFGQSAQIKLIKWGTTFIQKTYPDIFIIGEKRTQPSGAVSYILHPYDLNNGRTMSHFTVERERHIEGINWTKHFFTQQLQHIPSVNVHTLKKVEENHTSSSYIAKHFENQRNQNQRNQNQQNQNQQNQNQRNQNQQNQNQQNQNQQNQNQQNQNQEETNENNNSEANNENSYQKESRIIFKIEYDKNKVPLFRYNHFQLLFENITKNSLQKIFINSILHIAYNVITVNRKKKTQIYLGVIETLKNYPFEWNIHYPKMSKPEQDEERKPEFIFPHKYDNPTFTHSKSKITQLWIQRIMKIKATSKIKFDQHSWSFSSDEEAIIFLEKLKSSEEFMKTFKLA